MPRPKSEEVGVRIHVRLTKKQYTEVQKLAANGSYSVSETLRRAIDQYLTYVKSSRL